MMTNAYPKRLIEVDLPIARISTHARREKSIRHGHISTLHIWWARRPLAACRAVICASLWPDPADPHCPQAFRDAGLAYYNEAILITCVGSLPIRAGKQFSSGRKLGKTHQNILVFVKGDGKRAATRCGTVDVDESMFDGIETVGGDEG